MFRITPIVKNLIIVNVVVFILLQFLNIQGLYQFLSLHSIHSELFKPHQVITYMFLHAGFSHILFNMFGLFIFGPLLESFIGPKRFLFFYMACGIGAGLINMGWDYFQMQGLIESAELFFKDPDPVLFSSIIKEHRPELYSQYIQLIEAFIENPENQALAERAAGILQRQVLPLINIPMVGASGAVMGVLLGTALYFPNTQMFLFLIPFPIKLKYLAIFYAVTEYFAAVRQAPGDNVAHLAHLGGMFVGLVIVLIWKNQRNKFY